MYKQGSKLKKDSLCSTFPYGMAYWLRVRWISTDVGGCLTVQGALNKRHLEIYGPRGWEKEEGRARSGKVLSRVKKIVFKFSTIGRLPNRDTCARNADVCKSMAIHGDLSPCMQQLSEMAMHCVLILYQIWYGEGLFLLWSLPGKAFVIAYGQPEKSGFLGWEVDSLHMKSKYFYSQDLKLLSSILGGTFPHVLISLKSECILQLTSSR